MANSGAASIVYLLDSNPADRSATESLLLAHGNRVMGCASGAECFEQLESSCPACAVIDHCPLNLDAHEVFSQLRLRDPSIPALITSKVGAVADVSQAMRAGAIDFLDKPVADGLLLERVAEAHEIHAKRLRKAQRNQEVQDRINRLSDREQTVMQLVVQGQPTKAIARRLDISHKTVEVHRSNITKRMGVESVPQLVRMVTEYEFFRKLER